MQSAGEESTNTNQYLDSGEWGPTESPLHYRNGEWYLHLDFRKPETADGTDNCFTRLHKTLGKINTTSAATHISSHCYE